MATWTRPVLGIRGTHVQRISKYKIGVWSTGSDDVGLIQSTKAPKQEPAALAAVALAAVARNPCGRVLRDFLDQSGQIEGGQGEANPLGAWNHPSAGFLFANNPCP